MKYGYFDDKHREYVIETPETPLPWINYLGSEDFFGLISNTMGGYCFYRDAKLQRLLRYRYNSVPSDTGGRFCYIKERGKPAWNPGFLPSRTALDHYECRHGMGYTTFRSEKDGLRAGLTCFVPLGGSVRAARPDAGKQKRRSQKCTGLRLCGMVPVERGGRRSELPAQPQYRGKRSGRERHLP